MGRREREVGEISLFRVMRIGGTMGPWDGGMSAAV
jgi:hypothetical protein